MVDSMHDVVQISHHPVIKQVFFTMEKKTMEQVFGQAESKDSQYKQWYQLQDIYSSPVNFCSIIGQDQNWNQKYVVPFVMGENLEVVCLKHPRGVHEQPMRRIYYFQVGLVIHVPYLRQQCFLRINHSFYLFFEGAHHHGVCHHQGQGEMGRHCFGDVFRTVVENESGSSWMMFGESGGIQHIAIEDDQNLIVFGSVLLNFFLVFKLNRLKGFLHFIYCSLQLLF